MVPYLLHSNNLNSLPLYQYNVNNRKGKVHCFEKCILFVPITNYMYIHLQCEAKFCLSVFSQLLYLYLFTHRRLENIYNWNLSSELLTYLNWITLVQLSIFVIHSMLFSTSLTSLHVLILDYEPNDHLPNLLCSF